MTISEKVAYLKGLAEGLNIEPEQSKEAKLISVMMDILEDIGLTLNDIEENALDLGEEIDALSDDLAEVEDIVYDCCCGGDEDDDDDDDDDDDEDEFDDEDFFEVDCPNCGDALIIDQDVLDKGVVKCPNCKERFALDFSDEESGCGGCCGSCGGCAPADEDE